MDEVDLTEHLPPDFFKMIRSMDWMERRDILSAFIDNLSRYQRIDPKVKYNDVFAEFKLVSLFGTLSLFALIIFLTAIN